jgi:hypothetical protein
LARVAGGLAKDTMARFRLELAALFVAAGANTVILAAQTTGTITGIIKDASGGNSRPSDSVAANCDRVKCSPTRGLNCASSCTRPGSDLLTGTDLATCFAGHAFLSAGR